jgi:glyoxylase I family protein
MIQPQFVDHLVWRVRDLIKTEKFYTAFLGPPHQRVTDSIMYQVGDTRLFFTRSTQHHAGNDKEGIGLNHFALGVRTLGELQKILGQLDVAGITHSGIQLDPYGSKEFIWMDDPDGLRVEFYLRPRSAHRRLK